MTDFRCSLLDAEGEAVISNVSNEQNFGAWEQLVEYAQLHNMDIHMNGAAPPLCVGAHLAFNWGYCWSIGVIVRPVPRKDRSRYKWIVKYGEKEYRQLLADNDRKGGPGTVCGDWVPLTRSVRTP